ncbi:MAG: hypothetical protein N3A62_06855 [Thermodesulfovibrionales bacterium]|nr:hypothetical protein [Thermodesulfovibrionales bacterium]
MIDEPLRPVSVDIPQSIVRFCSLDSPYEPDEKTDIFFIEAMRDVIALHIEHSPWYSEFANQNNIRPEFIKTIDDLIAIPLLPANFFKYHAIRSIHSSQVFLHLTSSGTTGQRSQIFFDEFTITKAREMVDTVMKYRGVVSDEQANYLMNAYEPYEGFEVGTSNTNNYLMKYAPVANQFWSLRYVGSGKHDFDLFGCIETLKKWQSDGKPVRIIGFPAFLYFILERMRELKVKDIKLPKGSLVFFGGGWKGHADKEIPKAQFYEQIQNQLGIESQNIVESYGSVEHSIPYIDCPLHHLHQPVWSRVIVRDVKTLKPVPDGQKGFLSFLSPYITSVAAHSVIMGDMAVKHPAGSCPLKEYPTPWFEILGRAGTSTNKSCAIAAAEFLKGR